MTEPAWNNTLWWTENTKVELTDDQSRCLETVCAMDNIYNLDRYLRGDSLTDRFKFEHGGLMIHFTGSISTFDCSRLTQLVLAAHRNCCRVEIRPAWPDDDDDELDDDESDDKLLDEDDYPDGRTYFEIWVRPRRVEGTQWYERHPSLADLSERAKPQAETLALLDRLHRFAGFMATQMPEAFAAYDAATDDNSRDLYSAVSTLLAKEGR